MRESLARGEIYRSNRCEREGKASRLCHEHSFHYRSKPSTRKRNCRLPITHRTREQNKEKIQAAQWQVCLPPMARAKRTNMLTKGKLQLLVVGAPHGDPMGGPPRSCSTGRKSMQVNEAHCPQSTLVKGDLCATEMKDYCERGLVREA